MAKHKEQTATQEQRKEIQKHIESDDESREINWQLRHENEIRVAIGLEPMQKSNCYICSSCGNDNISLQEMNTAEGLALELQQIFLTCMQCGHSWSLFE